MDLALRPTGVLGFKELRFRERSHRENRVVEIMELDIRDSRARGNRQGNRGEVLRKSDESRNGSEERDKETQESQRRGGS